MGKDKYAQEFETSFIGNIVGSIFFFFGTIFFAAVISAILIVFAVAENFFIPVKKTSTSNLGL